MKVSVEGCLSPNIYIMFNSKTVQIGMRFAHDNAYKLLKLYRTKPTKSDRMMLHIKLIRYILNRTKYDTKTICTTWYNTNPCK